MAQDRGPPIQEISFEPVTPNEKLNNNQDHSETVNTSMSPGRQEKEITVCILPFELLLYSTIPTFRQKIPS